MDDVLLWVAWEKISLPKDWGGWGKKDLPSFANSMAEKLGWRLLIMDNLWTLVIKRKYIDPISMDGWLRTPAKKFKTSSVVLKATLNSFDLIVEDISWKVWDGRRLGVGVDPWVGCSEVFFLPRDLLDHLSA